MKFKKGASVTTGEFWYDLTDGGYIKPEKLLKDKVQAKKITEAVELLREFKREAEEQGVIEEM